MSLRTWIRWGIGLAAYALSSGPAYAEDYLLDTWQFTPCLDTEYKVDIYGVRSPTPAKPYETWVLLHDDHPYKYAGYVPEFGYHRWHVNLALNEPGLVGLVGNVSCRTNTFDWQAVQQVSGQSIPGWMDSAPGVNEVASTSDSESALSSVAVGDRGP